MATHDRKEYILEKAFEVFMSKGYDSVSMTVLQETLQMSRGAMYRYFESKDDLFIAVVDKYIIDLVRYLCPEYDDNITLLELINAKHKRTKEIGRHLDKIEKIEFVFLNFTALIIQAAKIYPGFIDKLKKYKELEMSTWKKAIENSKQKGDIREDINVKMMTNIFMGATDKLDPEKGGTACFSKTSDSTKKTMYYLYSLIKT